MAHPQGLHEVFLHELRIGEALRVVFLDDQPQGSHAQVGVHELLAGLGPPAGEGIASGDGRHFPLKLGLNAFPQRVRRAEQAERCIAHQPRPMNQQVAQADVAPAQGIAHLEGQVVVDGPIQFQHPILHQLHDRHAGVQLAHGAGAERGFRRHRLALGEVGVAEAGLPDRLAAAGEGDVQARRSEAAHERRNVGAQRTDEAQVPLVFGADGFRQGNLPALGCCGCRRCRCLGCGLLRRGRLLRSASGQRCCQECQDGKTATHALLLQLPALGAPTRRFKASASPPGTACAAPCRIRPSCPMRRAPNWDTPSCDAACPGGSGVRSSETCPPGCRCR